MKNIENQNLDALRYGPVDSKGSGAGLLAGRISLAATPVFGIMALLTGLDHSPMGSLCSSGHETPLAGMVMMYLLMSAFHSPPWFRLIGRTNKAQRL
jgi:hypothetical protein